MKRTLWVLVFMLLLTGCSVSIGTKEWLTAPLQRNGDVLTLIGPDLSEAGRNGQVYTYFAPGEWVVLNWDGYMLGANVFTITDELKADHPDWETNQRWSVDFFGNSFSWMLFGARVGTSAS